MTAAGKSLVERLGWHHEHPVTGKMVLVNPDGPEAAAEIEILRNLVDERTNDAAKEWERAEATESRLATLLAPSEGDKTTAEERRAARELLDDPDNDIENEFVLRLLDDLDHATAQARSAADAENEACARITEERASPKGMGDWIASSIRARRKTGNG